jgi:alpha-N-arabinofuranosidase
MFSLDDVSAPAFVGRRQEHFAMTAATRLDFSPAQTGEEAGLTLRLDESSHYDIAIRRGAAGAEIIVRLRTRSGMTIAHSEPAVGPITLQIKSTAASYTFACSTAVTGWKTIAAADARPLAPESTPNCFTGVVIALYATGNGKPCAAPADFDWFEYLPQK